MYGEISACIALHGETSSLAVAKLLQSCVAELALGPFGPQSSPIHRGCSWSVQLNHSPLNAPKNAPRLAPKLSPNCSKIDPGTLLETSWLSCAFLCPYFGLQEASWTTLWAHFGIILIHVGSPGHNFNLFSFDFLARVRLLNMFRSAASRVLSVRWPVSGAQPPVR